MNFLNLQYFSVVAKELNFTRSADQLHISQQSLSSHILRLEKECGIQLFHRDPPLRLTSAGEEFLKSANIILKEKASLEKKLAELIDFQQGNITIGVPNSRSAILMPKVLAQFHQEFPNVKVRLVEGSTNDIFKDLSKEDVDFIFGFQPNESERLESKRIYLENTKIIVPNSLLDAMGQETVLSLAQRPLPLKTFAALPFVALSESTLTGNVLHQIAQEEDFTPNIVIETKNLLTMLSLCCEGIGVCICPNSFLSDVSSLINPDLLRQTTAFSLRSDYGKAWIALTWIKNKYQSVPEKRLIQMLKESYADQSI